VLVGGLACGAALLVLGTVGASIASRVSAWIVAAIRGEARFDALMPAVLELAAPIIAVAAIVAVVAHVAQTRGLWLPRRSIEGAPFVDHRHALFDVAAAIVVGGVAFGWLWLVAPRLAALPEVPLAAGLLVSSAAATLAIAWVVIGVFDALLRSRALANAMFMTAREKREDDRLGGADPRWRAYRARVMKADAMAGATLLVLGDDVAVAIAWDPVRRPIPVRVATGRGARATQLLGLARKHRVPVHREQALAHAIDGLGPVAEKHWPRLAEVIAAVKR
jgi:flagellar biosynthesis protein FlhB